LVGPPRLLCSTPPHTSAGCHAEPLLAGSRLAGLRVGGVNLPDARPPALLLGGMVRPRSCAPLGPSSSASPAVAVAVWSWQKRCRSTAATSRPAPLPPASGC